MLAFKKISFLTLAFPFLPGKSEIEACGHLTVCGGNNSRERGGRNYGENRLNSPVDSPAHRRAVFTSAAKEKVAACYVQFEWNLWDPPFQLRTDFDSRRAAQKGGLEA